MGQQPKRVAWLALALVGLLATAGCQNMRIGFAGATVNTNGSPVGVFMICDKELEKVVVESETDGRHSVMGEWMLVQPRADIVTIDFRHPGEEWRTVTPLPNLDDATDYHVFGVSSDGENMTWPFQFSANDVTTWTPGSVLFDDTSVTIEEMAKSCETE